MLTSEELVANSQIKSPARKDVQGFKISLQANTMLLRL